MSILLVHPGVKGLEAGVPFKVRRHRDAALFPWQREVRVLEGVVKADLTCILQTRREIDVVDARPVDGAHAHRAWRAVDVDFAALEHARARRY